MRRLVRLLPALLLLAGCARPVAHPDPAATVIPSSAAEYRVREATLENGALAVRVESPLDAAGQKPTVISLVGNQRTLVAAGFVVVTYSINWNLLKGPPPPAPDPETAAGKWVLASPSKEVLGERYFQDIAATAANQIPLVLDYLATVPDVDPGRIGIAGGSTNGFIALQAAVDPRIGTVVAIAACGDYFRFLQLSSMGMEGKPLELAPAYAEWLRSQEPIRRPRRLVHAAVLMVNRTGDTLIPIACADETAKVFRGAYARAGMPERFRYVRIEAEGHGIAAEEQRETLAWVTRWLKEPGDT